MSRRWLFLTVIDFVRPVAEDSSHKYREKKEEKKMKEIASEQGDGGREGDRWRKGEAKTVGGVRWGDKGS